MKRWPEEIKFRWSFLTRFISYYSRDLVKLVFAATTKVRLVLELHHQRSVFLKVNFLSIIKIYKLQILYFIYNNLKIKSSEIFENSFFKNSKLEFWPEALFISIKFILQMTIRFFKWILSKENLSFIIISWGGVSRDREWRDSRALICWK